MDDEPRIPWRSETNNEGKEVQVKMIKGGNEVQVKMIQGYREKIESELAKFCEDILDVLANVIHPAVSGE
ncbi:hypothetical protein BD310DRAFT_925963 [Dichomitus squalens]|uniref:Uncharacterized protein n=1 Tax=Dichomitus squalens TaxID=114155 RepID=A0A4Q9PX24_9APHY|nr:hypothetical protein BD310DRAFT_925963 [Dichomitus squalens]